MKFIIARTEHYATGRVEPFDHSTLVWMPCRYVGLTNRLGALITHSSLFARAIQSPCVYCDLLKIQYLEFRVRAFSELFSSLLNSVLTFMMRLDLWVFLAGASFVASLQQDWISPSDQFGEENPLPFETLSDSAVSFSDDNDNLFADSTNPTDFSSGMDGGIADFQVEASCPSKDEQLFNKRRTRRDGVCTPNGQPSTDDFINTLGVFGDPAPSEEGLQGAAASWAQTTVGAPCPPGFEFHLCCESEGDCISQLVISRLLDIFRTMNNCEPGMWFFCHNDYRFQREVIIFAERNNESAGILPLCVVPRKFEVCCDRVSYPSLSHSMYGDDLEILREHGSMEALPGYREWLAENRGPTTPTGQWCIKWGNSQGLRLKNPKNPWLGKWTAQILDMYNFLAERSKIMKLQGREMYCVYIYICTVNIQRGNNKLDLIVERCTNWQVLESIMIRNFPTFLGKANFDKTLKTFIRDLRCDLDSNLTE